MADKRIDCGSVARSKRESDLLVAALRHYTERLHILDMNKTAEEVGRMIARLSNAKHTECRSVAGKALSLLERALEHGTHEDECASLARTFRDEYGNDAECDCWMSEARHLAENTEQESVSERGDG